MVVHVLAISVSALVPILIVIWIAIAHKLCKVCRVAKRQKGEQFLSKLTFKLQCIMLYDRVNVKLSHRMCWIYDLWWRRANFEVHLWCAEFVMRTRSMRWSGKSIAFIIYICNRYSHQHSVCLLEMTLRIRVKLRKCVLKKPTSKLQLNFIYLR